MMIVPRPVAEQEEDEQSPGQLLGLGLVFIVLSPPQLNPQLLCKQ